MSPCSLLLRITNFDYVIENDRQLRYSAATLRQAEYLAGRNACRCADCDL